MADDVLVLKQGSTGYLLRTKMKYSKIIIKKGRIQNRLTPRELAFVTANIPIKYLR